MKLLLFREQRGTVDSQGFPGVWPPIVIYAVESEPVYRRCYINADEGRVAVTINKPRAP